MASFAQRAFTGAHTFLIRVSGGRFGSSIKKMPILLLETRGSKSGQVRTVPLTGIADGGDQVIIASNGGSDTAPAWFHNLQADPQGAITVRGVRTEIVARTITDADEYARLWKTVTELWPGYAGYAAKTPRAIPLVRLSRRP